MNKNYESAMFKLSQIDAVLFAIDEIFLDNMEDRQQHLFFVLEDLVSHLRDDLHSLGEDKRVVDAIFAVRQTEH